MTVEVKKEGENVIISITVVLLFMLVSTVLVSSVALAQPSPHNVIGRVTTNQSNGVQNGIAVFINNTDSGTQVYTAVNAPPIPSLRGAYAGVITGNNGDAITVISWNDTHYGFNFSSLLPTTTTVNLQLNTTRASEINLTILDLFNDTLLNQSTPVNVTVNVTVLGADGSDCEVRINFTNHAVLNVSIGYNFTIPLGSISRGSTVQTSYEIVGRSEGVSNVTIIGSCSTDGFNIHGLNSKTVYNVTVDNLPPAMDAIVFTDFVDLEVDGNVTVFCNVTVSEPNGAADIAKVNATFYQESVGLAAPNDNNDHYTNTSCTQTAITASTADYTCGFNVAYYANNGTWICNASAYDFGDDAAYANESTVVNELLAITVSSNVIDHGAVDPDTISTTDANITVRNAGNMAFSVGIYGYAPNVTFGYLNHSMNCIGSNITNENHRFSVVPNQLFSAMTEMDNDTITVPSLNPQQRTNDFAYGNDSNVTYWKVRTPSLTVGTCNGTVVFEALLP